LLVTLNARSPSTLPVTGVKYFSRSATIIFPAAKTWVSDYEAR
jgi:hypothetical protein